MKEDAEAQSDEALTVPWGCWLGCSWGCVRPPGGRAGFSLYRFCVSALHSSCSLLPSSPCSFPSHLVSQTLFLPHLLSWATQRSPQPSRRRDSSSPQVPEFQGSCPSVSLERPALPERGQSPQAPCLRGSQTPSGYTPWKLHPKSSVNQGPEKRQDLSPCTCCQTGRHRGHLGPRASLCKNPETHHRHGLPQEQSLLGCPVPPAPTHPSFFPGLDRCQPLLTHENFQKGKRREKLTTILLKSLLVLCPCWALTALLPSSLVQHQCAAPRVP